MLRIRGWTICLTLAALGLSFLGIVATTASMSGVPLIQTDVGTVVMLIAQTPMGRAWQVRIIALLFVMVAAMAMEDRRSVTWLLPIAIGSGSALASLAWTGHGAAGEGGTGWAELLADIVHLLAAGVWLGALAAFCIMLLRRRAYNVQDHDMLTLRALTRFASVGTAAVVLIAGSGLVNALILIGPMRIATLGQTLYGQILIAKLVLFGAMLVLAARNRFQLTPALGRALGGPAAGPAVSRLRWSLAIELAAAIAILGLVAWLGTLEPPA